MSLLDTVLGTLSGAWRRVQAAFDDTPVGSPVTACPLQNPDCKPVSAVAKQRLDMAADGIAYAKQKLPHGAGNQMHALQDTGFNSYFRMQAARDESAFFIPPKVEGLAQKSPASFLAAKAELAQGGNCGEHAWVVYDYLRRKYPDQKIQVAQKEGFDHAFVIIGDPATDPPDQLVVADAWPTKPTPVLWEDHFAYEKDPAKLQVHASSQGDARDYKQEMLDAGLNLNGKGHQAVQQSMSPEQTNKTIAAEAGKHWIWDHTGTARSDSEYEYVEASGGGRVP